MNNFPPELIYILIFGAFVLFQFLMKRFAKPRQPEALEEKPPAQDAPVPEDEPLPEIWGRPPAIPAVATARVERIDRSQALAASAMIARRRSTARSLMGTKLDLRRTIAMMAVLGPCRAQEPPDSR
ncbi:MAG: hypothetical protein ACKVQU_09150 [Burkholderiales bacterium]